MNCSFLAAEAGGHTLEAIAEMLDITREGVRQIQIRALSKLRAGLVEDQEQHEPSIHESRLATRPGHIDSNHEVDQSENERHSLSAVDG